MKKWLLFAVVLLASNYSTYRFAFSNGKAFHAAYVSRSLSQILSDIAEIPNEDRLPYIVLLKEEVSHADNLLKLGRVATIIALRELPHEYER